VSHGIGVGTDSHLVTSSPDDGWQRPSPLTDPAQQILWSIRDKPISSIDLGVCKVVSDTRQSMNALI
jgi:hypothetical protein